jgi:hypothetical protein
MFVSASTYLEALLLLLGDNSTRSRTLVKEFMELSGKENSRKEVVTGDDTLIDIYKVLIKSAIAENITQENESAARIMLLKIRSNTVFKEYPVERDILTDILTAKEAISAEQINQYLKRLRNIVLIAEMEGTTRKMFAKSRSITEIHDVEEQESEIARMKAMLDESVKSFEHRQSTSEEKASETYVSMSDPESIRRALETYKDRNIRGVIVTGLQGLNKSLGKRGGMGLGEMAVFAACSHHYKSGMLVSIMLWSIVYNKLIASPGKRALVYFVSLENEVHQNLMQVFKALYGRIEKRDADIESLSTEDILNWLTNYFHQFNIELFIDRFTPQEFSYMRYVKRFNYFAEQGLEVIVFDLDYLSIARGVDPEDTLSPQGLIQMIRENYNKFANHAKSNGYLCTTGHQLTKRAEEVAQASHYAVKKFNPSMMADSSDVFREVDILFFMHLENNMDGHKFLTMVNRKNRGNQDTPEKDKFFAHPFTTFGIEDDLNGPAKFVTDIDQWGIEQGARDGNIVDAAMF